MAGDPVAHLGGIPVAAVVEPAVLVTAARRVSLCLGVTQQHQTAHGILESIPVQNNLQAPVEDKVTGARLGITRDQIRTNRRRALVCHFEHDLGANPISGFVAMENRCEKRCTLFRIML
jgi:hypothetical protein